MKEVDCPNLRIGKLKRYTFDAQVICSTAEFTGSGDLDIQFNGDHNYQVPSAARIELVQ